MGYEELRDGLLGIASADERGFKRANYLGYEEVNSAIYLYQHVQY